jgi:hypothetical protein
MDYVAALHLCFGYAYVARDKPNVYAFLPELTASKGRAEAALGSGRCRLDHSKENPYFGVCATPRDWS